MKTLERVDSGKWLDRLLNMWPFCLDKDSIHNLVAFSWGGGTVEKPDPAFTELWFGDKDPLKDPSLFRNGIFFMRLCFPFWIGLHFRWCGNTCRRSFLQAGIGWKMNGRFGILLRIQSDESAFQGSTGKNYGQAQGWAVGTK
jgi:hypothetical protein